MLQLQVEPTFTIPPILEKQNQTIQHLLIITGVLLLEAMTPQRVTVVASSSIVVIFMLELLKLNNVLQLVAVEMIKDLSLLMVEP